MLCFVLSCRYWQRMSGCQNQECWLVKVVRGMMLSNSWCLRLRMAMLMLRFICHHILYCCNKAQLPVILKTCVMQASATLKFDACSPPPKKQLITWETAHFSSRQCIRQWHGNGWNAWVTEWIVIVIVIVPCIKKTAQKWLSNSVVHNVQQKPIEGPIVDSSRHKLKPRQFLLAVC